MSPIWLTPSLRPRSIPAIRDHHEVSARWSTHWREEFLAGGQAAPKSRPADERDDEIQRPRAKVGEITMNNELLLERCHRRNLPTGWS